MSTTNEALPQAHAGVRATGTTLTVQPTTHFARAHMLVRILVFFLCGALGSVVSWPFGILYLALPVVAAVRISSLGRERFPREDAGSFQRVLGWVVGFWGYLTIVTDEFPTGARQPAVHYQVTPSGQPTVGSAALRVLMSIPSLLVLCIYGIASGFLWLLAAIFVLVEERYPKWIFDFQCGVLRYQARVMSYHASLVEPYPPFTMDLGPADPEPHQAQLPQPA
jgi:hypothetical protein